MPRTRSLAFSELKIGIIAVAAIAIGASLIIAVGGQAGFFWQQYPLRTRFANVQGMKPGAIVRVAGKDVGKVTSVEFSGSLIDVGMVLNERTRPLITAKSRASIGSLSLLGEPIIEISAAPDGAVLAEGAYLESTGAGSPINDLATQARDSLAEAQTLVAELRTGKGTIGRLFTDEKIYNDLDRLLVSATRVAGGLEGTRGTAGRLLNDAGLYDSLKKSVDDLDGLLANVAAGATPLGRLLKDEAMGASMAETARHLEAATGRLTRSDNTAGLLLNDRTLYDRLTRVSDRLDTLLVTLHGTTGTAGLLLNDRQLYDNLNRTLTELQALIVDFRKDPRKYIKLSIF